MMYRFFCIVMLLFSSAVGFAQEKLKEKMNEIKLDADYLWSEATMANRDSATAIAVSQLMDVITENNINVTENVLKSKAEFIYIPRGESVRAFVYVKKGSLPSGGANDVAAETQVVQQQEETVASPADTVAPPNPATLTFSVTPTTSATPTTPTTPASGASQTAVAQNTATVGTQMGTSVLLVISQCEQATDASRCLRDFKAEGAITDYGNVTSKSQLSENNYLIIYDKDRTIKAILAPGNGAARKNLATGDEDDIKNYSGCGVVWFK